ncbi:MAG: helix-turn-helix transcriptional regulator [Labilithrix sp.]|nr:helix-turn-helix transcriptional regulator [Labilithrix sp.]MCW5816566.1 helix-turn-helix transcriptional regulator [Labilithrix sp.]
MRPTEPSSADLRNVIMLAGEVGELFATSIADARKHLVASVPRLIGESTTWWLIAQRGGSAADLSVITSELVGLDESTLRRWQSGYLGAYTYRDHPMWRRIYETPSKRTVRREELVADREWNSSAHVADWTHGLGFDDTLGSIAPLGPDTFVTLAVCRPVRQRRFTARDAKLVDMLQTSLSWMNRAVYEGLTKHPRVVLRGRLGRRHARVLDVLLSGKSEKEAAGALGLSTRTVHKYVEHIYRVFSVSSRAELMALWIDSEWAISDSDCSCRHSRP